MRNYFPIVSKSLLQVLFLSCTLALALGINYIYAVTWTGPSALPPNANTLPPLNVTGTPQVKNGNLSVGLSTNTTANLGLTVYGSQSTNGTVYGYGNAGGVLSHGVVGTAGGANTQGVYGIAGVTASNGVNGYGPNNSTGYGVIGTGANSGYYGALGRADGYSFVGNGESYNQGIVRSTVGGFAFPDGTVQTTKAGSAALASMTCYTAATPFSQANLVGAGNTSSISCNAGYTALSGGCETSCTPLHGNYLSGNTQYCSSVHIAGYCADSMLRSIITCCL